MPEIRTFLLSLLFLLGVLPVSVIGQSAAQPSNVATKLDEYGDIRGCDHSARLDNLAVLIQDLTGSKAYVAAYAPEVKGQLMLDRIRDYLVNTRGILNERIETVYAGRNDVLAEARIQLWVVPAGAKKPKLQKFKPNLDRFQGMFAERERYDLGDFETSESSTVDEVDGSTGPGVGDVTHASLVDVLAHQKTAVTYIVSYNGEDAAPGAWRRVADNELADLKELGVETKRLKIVFGGSAKETKVQLWLVPPDAPPPVTDAGQEPPPKKSVKLFWFSDSELSDAKLERSVFKRIVDTLRQFPTLHACVIVRYGTYVEPPEEPRIETDSPVLSQETDGEDESPNQEVEREPADVSALVQKWQTELTETLKIDANRLIILFSHSDSYSNNHIETWMVPPGGRFPNLDDDDRR